MPALPCPTGENGREVKVIRPDTSGDANGDTSGDARGGGSSSLVLVAAHDEAVETIRSGLEPHGFRVSAVNDEDVVAACARLLPSVVLLDPRGPGREPSSVLSRLRDDERLANVPVVVLSSGDDVDEVLAALEVGFHDVLVPAAGPGELVARVAAAVRTRQLRDALRQREAELALLSRADALTGLANRRHVEEHLRMLAASARRQHQPLSMLMVDVDHLRRLNERYGHGAGDEVLKEVAVRCLRVLREEDLAGRWGGDKFLVLLPATDLDGSWTSGERIRAATNEDPVRLSAGDELIVTVSVGCAMGGGDDPEDQIRRADAAVRAAKASGRNRVVADTSAAA